MAQQEFEFSFDNCTPADAAVLAMALEEQFREDIPAAALSLRKDREDSQDFGATLVLVLGTPVAVVLARSIGAFLQRNSGASLTISASGEIIAKNLNSNDAARIAEAFAKRLNG
jgi:hypothetical protein